jgi:hypothetical protein
MFLSISLPLSRNLTPSLSYHIVRKRIAKLTDFLSFCPFGISIFPFLTIGISMYQKRILPYYIIPSTFSPQASSPFGALRTDNILHPPLPKFFFFSTERAGPYPQAQLYWAGRTMDGVDGRLNKMVFFSPFVGDTFGIHKWDCITSVNNLLVSSPPSYDLV